MVLHRPVELAAVTGEVLLDMDGNATWPVRVIILEIESNAMREFSKTAGLIVRAAILISGCQSNRRTREST
jgi:hypothetical protein